MKHRLDRSVRRAAMAGLIALAAAWLGGCASVPGGVLDAPEVRLASLTLREAGIDAQRFRIGLQVRNPNVIPIPIQQLRFSARLAGGGILDGRTVEPFTLAPGATQIVQVDVDSDLVSSLSRLLALVQGPSSTISYDLDGLVELSRGFQRTLPFNYRGEVALSMPAR
jgi:LEA14-like dessication related protein